MKTMTDLIKENPGKKLRYECAICGVNVFKLHISQIMWVYKNDKLELCCVKCYKKNKKNIIGNTMLYGDMIPNIK